MLPGAKGIALRIIKLCLFNYIDASYDLLQMPCDILIWRVCQDFSYSAK